jgi:DNA-binding transcriptional MerR regulator
MAELWRISELAGRARLKPSTIRYYEACGLLQPVQRTASGYRLYSPEQLKRLQLIRAAKEMGLTLSQIKQVLVAVDQGEAPCERVVALLRQVLARIEMQIEQLTAQRDILLRVLGDAQKACCFLLEAAGAPEKGGEVS